jgi:predicted transcriptional regulator
MDNDLTTDFEFLMIEIDSSLTAWRDRSRKSRHFFDRRFLLTMNGNSRPSHLEICVLRALWQNGPSTVSSVHEEMAVSRERAYTTVLTVLQNLEKKSLVRRVKIGRSHVYESVHSSEEVLGEMMSEFVSHAYGGDWYEAGHQLCTLAKLTGDQRSELADRLLTKAKRGRVHRSARKTATKPTKTGAKKGAKKRD